MVLGAWSFHARLGRQQAGVMTAILSLKTESAYRVPAIFYRQLFRLYLPHRLSSGWKSGSIASQTTTLKPKHMFRNVTKCIELSAGFPEPFLNSFIPILLPVVSILSVTISIAEYLRRQFIKR